MSVLEEEDPCSLVEYEDVLKHETIEGFVKIIQRRFSLKHVTYMCPSFAGRERKDPVLATTYSDEWVRHYVKISDHNIGVKFASHENAAEGATSSFE